MVIKEMPVTFSAYGLSDKGLVRQNNEDIWASLPEKQLYVLADGMGGHQAGEVASREAVYFFLAKFAELIDRTKLPSDKDIYRIFFDSFYETNRFVFELSTTHELLRGMGTTLCSLYFTDNSCYYAHVGDSRIYRKRGKSLEQLTRDHSLLQDLVSSGKIEGNHVPDLNYKNILTRAIGTEKFVEPVVKKTEVHEGDIFLMCSDGLSDLLESSDIEQILNLPLMVEEKVRALIHLAKSRGGYDNVTVVLVEVTSERDS